jgi:hypothetical protein
MLSSYGKLKNIEQTRSSPGTPRISSSAHASLSSHRDLGAGKGLYATLYETQQKQMGLSPDV